MLCGSELIAMSFVILITSTSGMVRGRPTTFPNDNVQVCGKDLADILQKACRSVYNNYHTEQDSSQTSRTRRKRGIIQECCLQPCNWTDLLAYCYFDPTVPIVRWNVTAAVESDPKWPTQINRPNSSDSGCSSPASTSRLVNMKINNYNNNNNNINNKSINNKLSSEIKTKSPCDRKDVENEILKHPSTNAKLFINSLLSKWNKIPNMDHLLNKTNSADNVNGGVKLKPLYFDKQPLMVNISR